MKQVERSSQILCQSIVAMFFGSIVAGAAGSGCATDARQPAPAKSVEMLGTLEAQPQTRGETGVDRWIISRQDSVFVLDGRTAAGVTIHQLRLQRFSTTVTRDGRSEALTGFDISSSGGGFVRFASDRRVLEFRPDEVAFTAFARDAQALGRGDVTLDCGLLDWVKCAGAVLGAIYKCGTLDLNCLSGLISSVGNCWDCLCGLVDCNDSGGGGSGGTDGHECTDCGDGTVACYPYQCP